ncbi:N-6 DNA Methylase [Halorientalis persicus]|uniref:site-specific DNA-methyltransferase (adenine-specific) n=1 Tax=Halorientalis persicus TaxID=1367881 RepID=A0A1H8U1Z7_9EURY|nr:N-6 DNA methylase [Halorientalis persicus]SEO97086.1 N-6 DNA Methylase [Halorientalis persicus]
MPAEDGFVPTPPAISDEVALSLLSCIHNNDDNETNLLYPGAGRGPLFAAVKRYCSVRGKPLPDAHLVEANENRAGFLDQRFGKSEPHTPSLSDDSRRAHTPSYPPGATAEKTPVHGDVTIKETNFLTADFDTKFDFAIANPPYSRYKNIDTGLRDQYREQYNSTEGSFPLYAPFTEAMINHLKVGGWMSVILPEQALLRDTFAPFRDVLLRENIVQIAALPRATFPDHSIETILLTLQKTKSPLYDSHFWVETLYNYKSKLEELLIRLGVSESEVGDHINAYNERVDYLKTQLVWNQKNDGKEGGYNSAVVPTDQTESEQSGLGAWSDD